MKAALLLTGILFLGAVTPVCNGASDQDVLIAAGGAAITLGAAGLQWWHLYTKTNDELRAQAVTFLADFDQATLSQKIWGYHDVPFYNVHVGGIKDAYLIASLNEQELTQYRLMRTALYTVGAGLGGLALYATAICAWLVRQAGRSSVRSA